MNLQDVEAVEKDLLDATGRRKVEALKSSFFLWQLIALESRPVESDIRDINIERACHRAVSAPSKPPTTQRLDKMQLVKSRTRFASTDEDTYNSDKDVRFAML